VDHSRGTAPSWQRALTGQPHWGHLLAVKCRDCPVALSHRALTESLPAGISVIRRVCAELGMSRPGALSATGVALSEVHPG
jgi:hypothetical protein